MFFAEPERSPRALVLDLVVVYGGVILSQVILAWLEPNLMLPRWAPTQGGYVGAMLFGVTRALLVALADPDCTIPTSSGASAKEIADTYSRYRALYGVAGCIALALGLVGLAAASIQVRIASTLVAIGSAYLLVHVVFVRSGRAEDPVDYGTSRPGVILRAAALWWYYGALFPASLVALFGSKVYLYWIPLVILLFAEANQSARRIALEEQPK
ncbi:MAG TPA: hypothetical protein VE621_15255 [Bryobacteraceae bacterium]|nr:hypothetical protein [Bryobacteraceae bacterium]